MSSNQNEIKIIIFCKNCGAYPFLQTQTICCTQFDYADIPDSDEDQCERFETTTTITDEASTYSFNINYDVTPNSLNMTVTQINPSNYYTFYYFGPLNVYGYCYGNNSGASSSCFKAFPAGDFQYEMILSFYVSPPQGSLLAYEGGIVGEIIQRNGMFFKNVDEPFTMDDPCWRRKAGYVNSNATVESAFCCTRFQSGAIPVTATTSVPVATTTQPSAVTLTSSTPSTSSPPSITSSLLPPNPQSNAIASLCSNDTTQAWLDIAFVIDTSNSMSRKNFNDLIGSILTFMGTFNFGQYGNHTIRVGIITYAADAVPQYELTDTTNYNGFQDFLFKLAGEINFDNKGGNIQSALLTAYDLLLFQKSFRKPVIILIAAAYDKTGFYGADKTANTIKNNGIHIIVINFATSDGVLTNALENIASPGYYYVTNQDDINARVPYALTQINCFCPPGSLQFIQYNTAWKNYTNYADCYYGYKSETQPALANRVCYPGVLAAITSQQKLDFITDNVLPHELPAQKKFTIGLHISSVDGQWDWWGYNGTEYSYGDFPAMSDPPAADDNYGYMWNHYGFNWTLQTGNNIPLPYICQARACDAEFICDPNQLTKLRRLMQKGKHFQ